MKLKALFLKRDFDKKYDKKMSYQTDPNTVLNKPIDWWLAEQGSDL